MRHALNDSDPKVMIGYLVSIRKARKASGSWKATLIIPDPCRRHPCTLLPGMSIIAQGFGGNMFGRRQRSADVRYIRQKSDDEPVMTRMSDLRRPGVGWDILRPYKLEH
ncbi:hypothetical protein DPSP01_000508 [Paraphaeosphaeria sporulosa]